MKVFLLNKKVILALMIIALLTLAAELQSRLAPAVATFEANNEIKKIEKLLYKSYSAMQGNFKFQLPDTWITRSSTFSGGEILYHLYFISPDNKLNGFVQVWSLQKPLKQFIEESKKAAVGPVDFKYFKTREIMSGRKRGYLIDYVRANDSGQYYRGYEAFIEGGQNHVYRVSFFVDEKNWKQYYIIMFNRIIQSFAIKE